jgi:NitT/TauT family transport system ATP-binding protein
MENGRSRNIRVSMQIGADMGGTPDQPSLPKIRVENLNFSYGQESDRVTILEDISFNVEDKGFVSLVGPSGCGKTTLMNIIAGLYPPTSGRVLLDGVEIKGPGRDRTMVFQDDAVFPWHTVEQNVEYGLRAAGIARAEREARTTQYLKLVGLSEHRDKFPRQLSGGMRKRVDLARALAPRPSVVLMDEPFASVDVLTKESLQEELLRIWSIEHMTVVFVTHDLEEALYLSRTVMVMSGRPAGIREIVDVRLDKSQGLQVKTAPEFQALRRDLAAYLHGSRVSERGGR